MEKKRREGSYKGRKEKSKFCILLTEFSGNSLAGGEDWLRAGCLADGSRAPRRVPST